MLTEQEKQRFLQKSPYNIDDIPTVITKLLQYKQCQELHKNKLERFAKIYLYLHSFGPNIPVQISGEQLRQRLKLGTDSSISECTSLLNFYGILHIDRSKKPQIFTIIKEL